MSDHEIFWFRLFPGFPFSSYSMSQELPTPSPQRSNGKVVPLMKPERELAWQIAPSLPTSFKYAGMGLVYAFQTQRNFRIHTFVGALALGLGLFLHLSPVEMAIIGLTIGAVLAMELLNTAIESVVDLTVKQSYHELAKIAKDCAAAAVLVSAIVSVLVAGSLILPRLAILLRSVLGW